MKVLGIITEYNPFHLGHKLHLQKSLAKTKVDAVICIMSGSFLQRGTPAIVNQWTRTQMALKAGVDLVIQLPVIYSTRSAEYFASGAVKLLTDLQIVDYLCFGSENGKIKQLKIIANLLADEPQQLNSLIKSNLNQGLSYPEARTKAVCHYIKQHKLKISPRQAKKTLTRANNILGIEYIKALTKLTSPIKAFTIKREGSKYYSTELKKISSASAIRNKIKVNKTNNNPLLDTKLKKSLPDFSIEMLKKDFNRGLGPVFPSSFSSQILTLLRRINKSELAQYEGVTGGLENRIKQAALKATSLAKLLDLINTKRFPQTRIQRILTHLLLKIDKNTLNKFDSQGKTQYIRVLGINNQGRRLLKLIKEKSNLPVITKVANHFKTNYTPRNLKQEMLSFDLRANDLYSAAYPNKNNRQGGMDFKQQPILDF